MPLPPQYENQIITTQDVLKLLGGISPESFRIKRKQGILKIRQVPWSKRHWFLKDVLPYIEKTPINEPDNWKDVITKGLSGGKSEHTLSH